MTSTTRGGPSRMTSTDQLTIIMRWPAPDPERHHCHAKNCPLPCAPERLTCSRHWFMCSKLLRDRVWATYRPGQCDDKNPSPAWHDAANAAIADIWSKELAAIEKMEKSLADLTPRSSSGADWTAFKVAALAPLEACGAYLRMVFVAEFDQARRSITIMLSPKPPAHRRGRDVRSGHTLG